MVHGPGYFAFGFHMLWLVGLMLVVLAGATVLVIWAIRESMRPVHPAGTPQMPVSTVMPPAAQRETPLDILARRFASGEITAEEYQRARDLLQGGGKT